MAPTYTPMKNIKISPGGDPTLYVVVSTVFANGSNIIVAKSGTYDTWDYNSDGTISSTYDPSFIMAAEGVGVASNIILADTKQKTGISYATWKWDSANKSFTLVTSGKYNLMVVYKKPAANINLIVDTSSD